MATGGQTGATAPPPAARALLDAAALLLAERSPSAISGRALAEQAGVNYGLVHRHFGSKQALLAAALDELVTEYATNGFDDDGVPVPLALAGRPALWRSLAHVLLDVAGFEEYRRSTPVLVHAVAAVRATRPGLGDRHLAAVVALALSIEVGLPLHRRVLARAVELAEDDPEIDRLVACWLGGLYRGDGPLGVTPTPLAGITRDAPAEAAPPTSLDPDGSSGVEERLVLAGARLLTDRAPSSISGRALAREAGVNYGLIHHYFGGKDEVLRQSVQLHRDRYFTAHSGPDRSPRFFSVCDHPGYVRAMTWSALDDALAEAPQSYPVTAQMIARHARDLPEAEATAMRVAVLTAVAAQMTWALFQPLLELALEVDPRELEPTAAGLLRGLLLAPACDLLPAR